MSAKLYHLKSLIPPLVAISAMSNIAVLVSPIFMMQVLDRVLASGNYATLLMLILVALGAYLAQSVAEFSRDSTLAHLSGWSETHALKIAFQAPTEQRQDRIDDVGRLTQFLKSSLAITCLNTPWLPLFLGAALLIHPLFFVLILAMVAGLMAIGCVVGFLTREPLSAVAHQRKLEQGTLHDAVSMQTGLGIRVIGANLLGRFYQQQSQRQALEDQTTFGLSAKSAGQTFIRSSAQILALSLGAYLVVEGQLTAGGMIAASIIVAKSVTSLESTLSSLGDISQVWASFQRLNKEASFASAPLTEVPELSGRLVADTLIYPRGQGLPPRLDRVSFELSPGQCLAIIGVSGSGKSTLLNGLCGIDTCPIGTVFLDETEIRGLSDTAVTNHIGYLPQRADLLSGTVAQNISCFDPNPDDEQIIQAAKLAGVHGLISALPNSYDTDIGQNPYLLSAGQQQRIGLARALYYDPKYLFLDEPNALLDADGERQLCDTLAKLKERGVTIVMILHRAGIMGLADKIMRLDNGRVADFGPRAEVLQRIGTGKQKIELPLNPHSMQDLHDWVSAQFARSTDAEFQQKTAMVATELLNIALQNRGDRDEKHVVFTFKFTSDAACELSLVDRDAGDLREKLTKINSIIAQPEPNLINLPPDEIALAVVMQVADDMKINAKDATCVYATKLSAQNTRTLSKQKRLHS